MNYYSPVAEQITEQQPALQRALHATLNVTVFLIAILTLTVPRGIGFASAPMLLVSLLIISLPQIRSYPLARQEKWLFAGLLAYPTAIAISMLLHGDWVFSNIDNATRFLAAIPIYLAIRKCGISRHYLYLGLMLGSIAAGMFGFYQKYLLGLPVALGFTHKIPFGNISMMLGLLSMSYWIKSDSFQPQAKWMLTLAVVACLFGMLGSLTSGTRGGWIGLPLLLWFLLSEIIAKKKILWLIYGGCVLAMVSVYSSNALVQAKIDRAVQDTVVYFENGDMRGSAGTRFEMWKAAGMMFQESPWIGIGKKQYSQNLKRLTDEGHIKNVYHEHAHNELFHILAELGVIGGVAFLLLFGMTIRYFIGHRNIDRQMATAGLILSFGYLDFGLTQAMFEHNISTSFFAFYIVIIAGVLAHQRIASSNLASRLSSQEPPPSGIT